MKRFSLLIYGFASVALLCTISCEKTIDASMVPSAGKYMQVYMPQATANPSPQSLYMVDTAQNILYSAYCGGFGTPGSNIKVGFQVNPALVDSFNHVNGTAYPVLPAGSYTLRDSTAVIAAGQSSTPSLGLSVMTNNAIKANTSYLLPVSISHIEGAYPVNNNLRTAYFLVRASYVPGDPRNIDWSGFNMLLSFNGSLLGRKSTGQLYEIPLDASGNLGDPRGVDSDWTASVITFPFGNNLISLNTSGNLQMFPVDGSWNVGTPAQIGVGFGIFNILFAYGNALIGIQSNGALLRYPIDNTGHISGGGQIGSGWNIFDMVIPYSTVLLARKPTGELLSYALDATGAFGASSQIGSGFDAFDMIVPFGNTLICRKPDGELWSYPLDASGHFGTAIKIGG
jgi:hypothetical protein